MSEAVAKPGTIVAWWEGGALTFGVIADEEKHRLRMLMARGKEQRIKASRIVVEVAPSASAPGGSSDERRAASERVAAVEARIREQAGAIDVPLLWELSGSAAEAGQPCTVADLAELALASPHGDAQAAVIMALAEEGLHFARKNDTWEPREAQAVEDLRLQRERKRQREAETEQVLSAFATAARGGGWQSTGLDLERRYLEALEQLAVFEDAATEANQRLALTALRAAGVRFERPHAGAFELLRRVGRFASDDVNLQLLRYELEPAFPAEVLAAADDAARRGFDDAGRSDLTGLAALSIDSPQTKELDDLLSVEPRDDGGFRVGVHIADPGALIEPDGVLDREALSRGLTRYMPDCKILMLPPAVSEEAASLSVGADRPALSFLIDIDGAGEIADYRIERTLVRSAGRLDYDAVDRALSGDDAPDRWTPTLQALDRMAERRQQARIRQGALILDSPEIDVLLDEEGRPYLSRIDSGSAARRIVTESMVLAGAVAAAFCVAAAVPAIYRRQAPSNGESRTGVLSDPVAIRAARRTLKRAETGLAPGRHTSLGLDAYAQATSPLRRFADLTLHRQLTGVLAGGEPPLDEARVRGIAARTEQAELTARRAERAAHEFWLLRYLERQVGDVVEGVVLETSPRKVIQLVDSLREQAMPSLSGVEPGQRVTVRIERVAPREGLLNLRRVD